MAFEVRPTRDLDEFTAGLFAIGQYFAMVPTEERVQRFVIRSVSSACTWGGPTERSSAARRRSRSTCLFPAVTFRRQA
jgi:hypothetical protein